MRARSILAAAGLAALLGLSGCTGADPARGAEAGDSQAYVGAHEPVLRDRLGMSFSAVARLRSGERVEIRGRRRAWVMVRTSDARQGWVDGRQLLSADEYKRAAAMPADIARRVSQGAARSQYRVNLHLDPDRQSASLFRLDENESCAVIDHAVQEDGPRLRDWYLVRAKDKAGWTTANTIRMAVPDDISQYSEGHPIATWHVLDTVTLPSGSKDEYVWATRSSGSRYDFDGFRVFIYSKNHHRYETAYRERKVRGVYPITVKRARVGDSEYPTFSVQTVNEIGQLHKRTFVLLGNVVRPLNDLVPGADTPEPRQLPGIPVVLPDVRELSRREQAARAFRSAYQNLKALAGIG